MADDTVDPPVFTSTDGTPPPADSKPGILRGLPGGKRVPPKDTPPKRRSNTRGSSTPSGAPKPAASGPLPHGAIAAGMANLYGQVGMFWGMFDPTCGKAIATNALAMGESLEAAAKESPAFREFCEKLISTSVWGQVIAAHAPVVAIIAMHHVPAIRNKFNPATAGTPDSGIGTQSGQASNMKTGTAG